jgi:hypothetical protein
MANWGPHLGRIDFQVKILGHRVELGEIEAIVRNATGLDGIAAVGWPPTPYAGMTLLIVDAEHDLQEARATRATAKSQQGRAAGEVAGQTSKPVTVDLEVISRL